MKILALKYLLPVFISASVFAMGMITQHRLTRKCPDCVIKCPQCPPVKVQSIDFEKVKGMKGTIVLNQNYEVQMNGDSLTLSVIQKALHNELLTLKIAKCK